MQKLFIDYTPENEIILDGERARHIAKSLRMKVGDMLTVCSGGEDLGCLIEEITKETVKLSVCYKQAIASEPGPIWQETLSDSGLILTSYPGNAASISLANAAAFSSLWVCAT